MLLALSGRPILLGVQGLSRAVGVRVHIEQLTGHHVKAVDPAGTIVANRFKRQIELLKRQGFITLLKLGQGRLFAKQLDRKAQALKFL